MLTGPNRGKQYCYVCELKDEPAVLVFARRTDEPTARLMRELRDAAQQRRSEKLFGWVVFLGSPDAENDLERQTYAFARQNGATNLTVSVLADPAGPPGYLIAPEADVTLIAFRSGKVLYNRAYRSGEWTNRSADSALRNLAQWFSLPVEAVTR